MNPQEKLWAGEFGDEYIGRNRGHPANDKAFFERVLAKPLAGMTLHAEPPIVSVLELGANIGNNIRALRRVLPDPVILDGVEINETACAELSTVCDRVYQTSVLDFDMDQSWDMVFTKGLLIHIHPDDLPAVYRCLYDHSDQYILICEYFNTTPIGINYRGQKQALWRRDFGGDMLDLFPTLKVIDYGFSWRRDERPQDNITWFLMEKTE